MFARAGVFAAGTAFGLACVLGATYRAAPGRVGVAESELERAMRQTLQRLNSPDAQQRAAAGQELYSMHVSHVWSLLEMAQIEADATLVTNPRGVAVFLLSSYGTREAIPFFIEHVEYRETEAVSETSEFVGFPCARALALHGRSATPKIYYYLATTRSDKVSDGAIKWYAKIILATHYSNGDSQEQVLGRLRAEAEKGSAPRKNVWRLIAAMEQELAEDKRWEERAEAKQQSQEHAAGIPPDASATEPTEPAKASQIEDQEGSLREEPATQAP